MSTAASTPWPDRVWQCELLRGLDEAGREALRRGGRLRTLGPGGVVFAEGAGGDAVYVVVEGAVSLSAIRRGDEVPTELRRVGPGDTFGEEPILGAATVRRATATGVEAGLLVELPAQLVSRVVGREAAGEHARDAVDRRLRRLQRNATRDLLRTMAATRDLPDRELDLVLDAVQHRSVPRGTRIYAPGDRAAAYHLVVEGLVQLQTEQDVGDGAEPRVGVCAYVARGDGFGDEEVLDGVPRRLGAVSMGVTTIASIPAEVLRTLVDRNAGLAGKLSRVAGDRAARQSAAVASADIGSTRHVFHDVYRMQIARSMLVIDQDSCVRCGHCAWTCAELHGTARLVRRGDKVITRLSEPGASPRSLMVVNSCQHCKNPSCMLDCPTGAIGRDPEGEVFIREDLCTGCESCAKACPWDNIRMAPRPGASRATAAPKNEPAPGMASLSATIATKCDLCRGYDGPGCVMSCPTDAMRRLDPASDVAEVADLLGEAPAPGQARAAGRAAKVGRTVAKTVATWVTIIGGLGGSAYALAQRRAGAWVPDEGTGYWLGVAALAGMLLSAAYGLRKRIPRTFVHRLGKRARRKRQLAASSAAAPPPRRARSRVSAWLSAHLLLGTATLVAVFGHAGLQVRAGPYGSLQLATWALVLLGVGGALAYRLVPRRLSRIERHGALPEDLAGEREVLLDALYRKTSGAAVVLKQLAARVLVPYANAAIGPIVLLASGRSIDEARAQLRARVDTELPRLAAGDPAAATAVDPAILDELVRIVVELRALPARRVLTRILRAWLPVHAALTGIVLALCVVHVVVVLGRPS